MLIARVVGTLSHLPSVGITAQGTGEQSPETGQNGEAQGIKRVTMHKWHEGMYLTPPRRRGTGSIERFLSRGLTVGVAFKIPWTAVRRSYWKWAKMETRHSWSGSGRYGVPN